MIDMDENHRQYENKWEIKIVKSWTYDNNIL